MLKLLPIKEMAFSITTKRLWRKTCRHIKKRTECLILVIIAVICLSVIYRQLTAKKKKRDVDRTDCQALSKNLTINYKLLKYIKRGEDRRGINKHHGLISIRNTGKSPILLGSVALYFCFPRRYLSTKSKRVRLVHISGCLHKIETLSRQDRIFPEETIFVKYVGEFTFCLRSQHLTNWYLVCENNEIAIVENTKNLSFVDLGEPPSQSNERYFQGYTGPSTPDERYDFIGFDPPQSSTTMFVIPQPLDVIINNNSVRMAVDESWMLIVEKGLETEAEILKDFFKLQIVSQSKKPRTKFIMIRTGDPGIKSEKITGLNINEGYELRVRTADKYIQVTGKTSAGVFYGIQTLLSLAEQSDLHDMLIKDAPRFPYRGMHLDVSRNFYSKQSVMRLLDQMARYKMNKFHFHLSDDEAWRIEIPGLPELTEIGSKQCHDPTGLRCIQPQFGSDPRGTASPTFYTVHDYQQILKYANERHIQVIPEIDFPGHSHAAILAMKARFRILKQIGKYQEAEEFLLSDFGDNSEYLSVQGFTDNTLNPCLESTYRFAKHVMQAVKRMHRGIQPLTTYHFGGDEVPVNVWKNSPACNKETLFGLIDEYSEKRLIIKEHFVRRMIKIASSLGLKLAGWDDFFHSDSEPVGVFAAGDITVFSWTNEGTSKSYDLAEKGYKVVLVPAVSYYFDHPYEFHPEELGNVWATPYSDTRKVFESIPDFCKAAGACGDSTVKVHGISGALWSEHIRTADQLDSMIFPRLLALAERAWHKAPWEGTSDNETMKEEWKNFSSFLVRHELKKLERLGIKYHIPVPGARFKGKKLLARTVLPGLPVQYSKDGGKTWHDVTEHTEFEGKITLATSSLDRQRRSRPIELDSPTFG